MFTRGFGFCGILNGFSASWSRNLFSRMKKVNAKSRSWFWSENTQYVVSRILKIANFTRDFLVCIFIVSRWFGGFWGKLNQWCPCKFLGSRTDAVLRLCWRIFHIKQTSFGVYDRIISRLFVNFTVIGYNLSSKFIHDDFLVLVCSGIIGNSLSLFVWMRFAKYLARRSIKECTKI